MIRTKITCTVCGSYCILNGEPEDNKAHTYVWIDGNAECKHEKQIIKKMKVGNTRRGGLDYK